ncbi:unnamed protein product [Hermetia illucens]|uniref:Uncharacterized protein n=1 Tax=Hermetia illucens TaxID=343691 RepID=A0A7R8YYP2_HERIL|nr:major royal jelly protein 1-like [Hermetia illucens]CAD7090714.1 unnamed protein product [Hermetia illucens]
MRKAELTGLFSLFLTVLSVCVANRDLRVVVEWKEMEFSFPTEADRSQAIKDGRYVRGNSVPIDVDVHYFGNSLSTRRRIFVTIPRFSTGIPISFGTVTNLPGEGGPQIKAYPAYSWHSSNGQDCNGITSAFRVAIDECERLWIIDTGRIGDVQSCIPQLLAFDLRNDTLIHRYRFPQSQYGTGVSLFATPIVDVRSSSQGCRKTMVYIADIDYHGLVVYDYEENTSWRIENKLMYPNPDWGTFTIAGQSFDLMDGLVGLALTPQSSGRERYLYFHAMAGEVENRVLLSLVDNRTIWIKSSNARPRNFVTIGGRGTQSAVMAIDSRENMFFGLMQDIAVASWNINTPYKRSNFKIVAQNSETLQFISGLKIKRTKVNTEELWAISNRFQKGSTGTRNSQEINYRILECSTEELLAGGC